ncbi:hypothetical protein G3I51_13410 [Streptomyces sp. SID9944]|nr:hypothetical protein [Streptomyces sp. SID9944]
MLQSPETAVELDRLRSRVDEVVQAYTFDTAALRKRVAELESSPLGWARLLDAKSLDNFMMALGMAADTDPADGALSQVEEMIRSFRAAVSPGAELERTRTLHDHIVARDAEIERLKARLAEARPVDEDPIAYALTDKVNAEESCDHPNGYGPNGCGGCGAFMPAADEDPHDSPLHHDYRVGRDLPTSAAEAKPAADPHVLRAEDTADILTLAPAQHADATYDPAFGTISLELTATREQWSAWQKALKVDLARTTNRGACTTSHATWRGIHVVIRYWPVQDGAQ